MGKHQVLGGKHSRLPDNLFPDEFDGEVIAGFFSKKAGVSENVLTAIEQALDGDTDVGAIVSQIAQAFNGTQSENDPVTEDGGDWVYLESHEEEFLHHADGHDDGDHIELTDLDNEANGKQHMQAATRVVTPAGGGKG